VTKSAAVLVLVLVLLCGCSTNPVTGRDQMVDLPAVQAHADVGFVLSKSAKRIAETEAQMEACNGPCQAQQLRFSAHVADIGKTLEAAARDMSPESMQRIGEFEIGVDPGLGVVTASSAGGRISLGAGLASLEPNDDVIAFLLAREMAHVIARHDEEDSGARMFFSAVTTLLPIALVARLVASMVGSGAMMGSWAGEQRREADEIAVALLVRTGRTVYGVARSLAKGLKTERLPEDEWTTRYKESAERVASVAEAGPQHANFQDWLARQSVLSIERFAACVREGTPARSQAEVLARRRECMGGAA
jgi:hypothetical protein